MIDLEDLRLYLPKYLSPETEGKLLQDLTDFPENINERMYSDFGKKENVIFQGDCIEDLIISHLPDTNFKKSAAIILSNTCDIDENNKRKYSSNIVYSPIIDLDKYINILEKNSIYTDEQLKNHINDIRKQMLTAIFYLPATDQFNESIIFFDRVVSCDNRYIDRIEVPDIRKFSLSQYGFYLLLFKLSIHFTRMHEKLDRVY